MLTAEGCRGRRKRLLDRLELSHPLLLCDPQNLRYLANFYVDPFSLGADYGGRRCGTPAGAHRGYGEQRENHCNASVNLHRSFGLMGSGTTSH